MRIATLIPSALLSASLLTLAVPAHADNRAVLKDGPCPSGTSSEGEYCVPHNDRVTVIGKRGPCPSGYTSEDNYCTKDR